MDKDWISVMSAMGLPQNTMGLSQIG